MADNDHKTVFVLDHTQYFSLSSEDFLPLDFLGGKPSGESSIQFSKSLWTCSVESSVEYCRIVWDLFPNTSVGAYNGKLVRFIVSDTNAHIMNTWDLSTQNMSHVMNAMALVGIPQRNNPPSSDYSVIHGLRAAIEALSEPTDQQLLHFRPPSSAGGAGVVIGSDVAGSWPIMANKGRVICITSARDNPSMKGLEDIFHSTLRQQNSAAAAAAGTGKKIMSIDHCHLVIINVVPVNSETLVTKRACMDLSPLLSSEIHCTRAPEISNKLTHLIMFHYDLASTTVTGIPMKEEQNANSSANYDVEILHARNAHTCIGHNSEALLPTSMKEGAEYETVTLKWCTPRGGCSSSDMQPCLAQHRVTPVDVTSRPSSCLINFLLNGRSVLLEMPRKAGGKTTSHLLSARGGEIFIHTLQITRSCLEELPSVSEGPGGRVTDYRVTDWAAFVKAHRCVPLRQRPKQTVKERLRRRSRYFPLTFTTSLVYNLQRNLTWLAHFLRRIGREDMDGNDETQCLQYIFELYQSATRLDQLPFSQSAIHIGRLKGQTVKKTEQYRLLYHELELILRNTASGQTAHHRAILEKLQNTKPAFGDSVTTITGKTESGGIIADLGSGVSGGKAIIRATTDSPLSPPHHSMESNNSNSGGSFGGGASGSGGSKSSNKRGFGSSSGGRSLLDIVSSSERSLSTKRMDFSGRLCTPIGQVAKLYPDFGVKEKEATSTTPATASGAGLPVKEDVPGVGLKL